MNGAGTTNPAKILPVICEAAGFASVPSSGRRLQYPVGGFRDLGFRQSLNRVRILRTTVDDHIASMTFNNAVDAIVSSLECRKRVLEVRNCPDILMLMTLMGSS